MKLSCIHCGQQFSITADQLGGRGRCPHCQGEIELPRADEGQDDGQDRVVPGNWLENSISGLTSMVIHMVLFIVACLITWGTYSGVGEGDDVLIGVLPSENLDTAQNDEQLSNNEEVQCEQEAETLDDPLEDISPPSADTSDSLALDTLVATPSPSGGGSTSFDLGTVSIGGSMAGGGWDGMIQQLRRNGLDIVIAFDSTGSMSGEINQVKRQIGRIGDTLTKLVPKTRIGVCTYRDEGDEYLVKGLPLTNDIQQVQTYLEDVFAGGGGDHPEAVQEGLRWPMENNQYRSRARKVILLFGDAPPHQQKKRECLKLAADFSSQQGGIVSTVTCRNSSHIPEFIEIAQMGGGEAFLTSDEKQIMTQLLVLVFGSRYRGKVLEAFKILGE